MKRILPFISITSGRMGANNMALCALRAIDFFFRNVTLRTTQTYVISSIETLGSSWRARSFSRKARNIGDDFASRDNKLFLDDRSSSDDRTSYYSFCVDAKIVDGQSARCVARTVARRRGSTALMFVSECRWAERRRKRPSARSGENRAALLGEECCQSTQ